jgi:hypothetical protein
VPPEGLLGERQVELLDVRQVGLPDEH